MTDNKVYVDSSGNETVQVNRADGLGVSEIKKWGIKQMIISTEKNPVVSTRADKLGIPCLQGIDSKKDVLIDYCNINNIDLCRVAYLGNDINDKEALEIVGLKLCPADAHDSIKAISNYVLETKGGDGVIREFLDLIIYKKGQ